MLSFQVTILRRNVLRDEMGGDCAATDCTLALRVLVVFMRFLGEPQRSLVLQKMLRNEHVRPPIYSQIQVEFTVQQGLKDNAFLLKGLCDEVSKMTPGYSGTRHDA